MKAIFIGGCDRSGTTWLAALLARRVGVAALPEASFIPETARAVVERGETAEETRVRFSRDHRFRSLREAGCPDMTDTVFSGLDARGAIERLVAIYAENTEAGTVEFFVEHSPNNIERAETLPKFFPDAKFLHIVRDGRGVAASLMPLDWGPSTIVDMAKFWRRAAERGLFAVEALGPEQAMTVSYEALVARFDETMRDVLRFLELDRRPEREGGATSYRPPGYSEKTHSLVTAAPDPSRIDNWRNKLSKRQIELFELEAGSLLERLGYQCISEPSRIAPLTMVETGLMKLRGAYGKRAKAARYRRRHQL